MDSEEAFHLYGYDAASCLAQSIFYTNTKSRVISLITGRSANEPHFEELSTWTYFWQTGVYLYICTKSSFLDVKLHRMSANWSSAPLQPLRVSRTSTLLAEYQPCVRNVESQNRCWKTFQKRIDAERICAATPTSVSDLFPLCCVLIKRLWNKGTWETCSPADTALGDSILHLHFPIVAEYTLRAAWLATQKKLLNTS